MLKQKFSGSVQEVILPDFPDDDNTVTTTVTKSRRVSFGPNFVKEFIIDSAVSAEYEQAFSSSDSSNADSAHSALGGHTTFVLHENVKIHKSIPIEPETTDNRPKPSKFASTICFSADSPTADMEFTEGCITLAKSILDKKNKEMTVFIQAKPKGPKEEEKAKEEETNYFEGSQFEMSMTKCDKIFNEDSDSDSNWEESKENRMPLDAIMRHLDKDDSDSDLFNPERSFGQVLGANPFEMSDESEQLNLNESMEISGDLQGVKVVGHVTQLKDKTNHQVIPMELSDKLDSSELLADVRPGQLSVDEVVNEENNVELEVGAPVEGEKEQEKVEDMEEMEREKVQEMEEDMEREKEQKEQKVEERDQEKEKEKEKVEEEEEEEQMMEETDQEKEQEEEMGENMEHENLEMEGEKEEEEQKMEETDVEKEQEEEEKVEEQELEKEHERKKQKVMEVEEEKKEEEKQKQVVDVEQEKEQEKMDEEEPKELSLGDLKVMESLKKQSEERGCIWSLKDLQHPRKKGEGSLSFSCRLLDSTTTVEFSLKKSSEDSLLSCSAVTRSSVFLDEEEQCRMPEYNLTVRFGFEKLKKYFEECRQRVETIRHVPYYMDQVNFFLSKMNAYLRQVHSVLTLYPGSRLSDSRLSFRLFSFPIFFSCVVSIDLSDVFRLSKASLTFEHDFGSLDEGKVGEILEECLKGENSLCEFVVQSTRYLVDVERQYGYLTRRTHIRLLPEELKS